MIGDAVSLHHWTADDVNVASATVAAIDPQADVAVLVADAPNADFAPLSAAAEVGDRLIGVGFPKRDQREELDQFSATYEGETRFRIVTQSRSGVEQKFKAGQVEPGFSGGPLLNLETGKVLGMTIATRDRTQALGGWAIGTEILQRYLKAAGVSPNPPDGWPEPEEVKAAPTAPASLVTQFQAPSLPMHYVERPDLLQPLVDQLCAADGPPGRSHRIVLSGGGGNGKTILATAIAHHRDVQARFPDGVLWTELGQQPQIEQKLSAWAGAIAGQGGTALTRESNVGLLRTALHDRAFLIVVDNVWEFGDLEPFLVGGPRCAVLITTRRSVIADEAGAVSWQVGDLAPEQARLLIVQRTPQQNWGEEALTRIDQLAASAGYIALAVTLIGGLLNRRIPIAEVERSLVGLKEMPRVGSPRHTLNACLQASLDFVRQQDAVAWQRFIWLAVTPPGATLNRQCCAILWNATLDDAEQTLWQLADNALLERQEHGFRIHDLLRQLAAQLASEAAPNGLGFQIAELHAEIVRRYQMRAPDGQWQSVPADGYLHLHLFWHVIHAGSAALAHKILLARTQDYRLAWFVACDAAGQRANYEGDVRASLRLFAAQEDGFIAGQILCALILTSLHNSLLNVSPKMLETLVARGAWSALSSFFGITQAYTTLDMHGVDLLIAFVRGVDQRCDADESARELSKRLRARALTICRESLSPPGSSKVERKKWAKLAPLLPETEAEGVVREIMTASNSVSDLIELAKNIPSAFRAAYDAHILEAIERKPLPGDRARLIARFLGLILPGGRAKPSRDLITWVSEHVATLGEPVLGEPEQTQTDRATRSAASLPSANRKVAEPPPADYTSNLPVVRDDGKSARESGGRRGGEENSGGGSQRLIDALEESDSDFVRTVSELSETDPDLENVLIEREKAECEGIITSEFMDDIAQAYYFLSKPMLTELNNALKGILLDGGAQRQVDRLSLILTLQEKEGDADARVDDVVERAVRLRDFEAAFKEVAVSSEPVQALVEITNELYIWPHETERFTAAWLPVWLQLGAEDRRRSAEIIRAKTQSVGSRAMCLTGALDPDAELEVIESDLDKLAMDEKQNALLVCASIGTVPLSELVLTRVMRIHDVDAQAAAVVTLMPYFPRNYPSDILDAWKDEKVSGTRTVTLVSVMAELISAISAGALSDVVESSARRESEWWLVEALTSTLRRIEGEGEFRAMLEAAHHIRALDLRARFIGRVARRSSDFGHFDVGIGALELIEKDEMRWDEAVELAAHLALLGQFDGARVAAASIASSEARSRAFAHLAIELAARGRGEEARSILEDDVIIAHWRDHVTLLIGREPAHERVVPGSSMSLAGHRKLEASPSDIRQALAAICNAMGELAPLNALARAAQTGDPVAIRLGVQSLWREPVMNGCLLSEVLARGLRSHLLALLIPLAPFISLGSEEDTVETVRAIDLCAKGWP